MPRPNAAPAGTPPATGNARASDRRPLPLRAVAGLLALPGAVLIAMVRVYQYLISPMLGAHCRFEPTCSQYFIEAVRKYGAVRGALKGIWRVCRCHPWTRGGYDPP